MKTSTERLALLIVAMCVLSACFFSPGCKETGSRQVTGKSADATYDDDYIAALAVAGKFCAAWRDGDFPTAMKLITRRLMRQHPDAKLRDAIIPAANTEHAAFQIGEGQRLGKGRFAFSVRLFRRYTGQMDDRIEAPLEEIVLTRDNDGLWRVDGFPMP